MLTRRRITLAVLAVTAMFALALPPLVGSQGQRAVNRVDRCADDGGRTLTASRSIRVYVRRDRIGNKQLRYCWVATGAATTLDSDAYDPTLYVPEYRIAGRYLGTARIDFDTKQPIDPGIVLTVAVRDVKRYPCVRGFIANPPPLPTPSFGYTDSVPGVTDLELTRGGGLAWIVSGWPDRDDYFYVQKADSGGQVVLDEGPAIDPRSLAISGRRVYWMNSGEAHSAVLQGRVRDLVCS